VADHQMIGKMGRVTGTVSPGRLGEVMVQVRGGSEAFHAYAADDDDETIPVGSRIVVSEALASALSSGVAGLQMARGILGHPNGNAPVGPKAPAIGRTEEPPSQSS
jgi:hypothetical protein